MQKDVEEISFHFINGLDLENSHAKVVLLAIDNLLIEQPEVCDKICTAIDKVSFKKKSKAYCKY